MKKCEFCNEKFKGNGWFKYCSNDCRKQNVAKKQYQCNHKPPQTNICKFCKNKYIAIRITQNYCSKACGQKYRNKDKPKTPLKELVCKKCNKVFHNKRSKQFCNRSCMNRYKYKYDIIFKLKKQLRSRVSDWVKGRVKVGSAVSDLGCTVEELKEHLETQFKPWMNWENYGKYDKDRKTWNIDHIIPLSAFNLIDKEEFRKAVIYTNLQPLLASDNFKKSSKMP